MKRPSYIVFLCFGDEGFFYECAFALLSISRFHYGPQYPFTIKIFTDKPEWFSRFIDCKLPLEIIELQKAQLKDWVGPADYIYRIKPALLQWLTTTTNANWLYMDTDVVITYPLTSLLAAIDGGEVAMHMAEGTPEGKTNRILRRLYKLCLKLPEGRKYTNRQTWNSGVVGFNSGHNNILVNTLQFIDEVYPKDKVINIMEQVALSWSFLEETSLRPALPYVLHYWNMKDARPLLAAFFKRYGQESWPVLTQLSGNIQLYALMLEKTRFGYNRTIADLLNGRKWQPELDALFPKEM